jgi:hypothetical protein
MGQVSPARGFLGLGWMARIPRTGRVPMTRKKEHQPLAILRHDLSATGFARYMICFG